MAKQVIDPWLEEDGFSSVDFGSKLQDLRDPDLEVDPVSAPNLNPEVISSQPQPVLELEPEGPEVFELEGIGTVTRRKTSKGWEVEVKNLSGGQPQVFKGANKDEVMVNLAKAQLNATQKIREQNRRIRTTPAPAPVATPAASPVTTPRPLTADEIVDIKLKLDTDPNLALSEWFQKATGLAPHALAQLALDAKEGKQARTELLTEQVGKAFLEANPDYFPTGQNFEKIIKYLAQYKLGRMHVKDSEATEVMTELAEKGFYTQESLEEAFEELSGDGSLQTRPAPTPAQQAPVTEPAPAPDNGRIVQREVRPRAAYGLPRTAVAAPPPTASTRAPSAEDFDRMTDEEVSKLLAQSFQVARASRRN